jgi:hypothetical protein
MNRELNEKFHGEFCGNSNAMKKEWLRYLDGKIPRRYLERYGKLEQ